MKVCTKCKENKELEEFRKEKRNIKNGRSSQCKKCLNATSKAARENPEEKKKNNARAKAHYENSTTETKVKNMLRQKARKSTPEGKAIQIAAHKKHMAIPENKVKGGLRTKAYKVAKKQERITDLMENFDKLESEISGTIYHFEINGVYKIGKALSGFDNRYRYKQDKENATQIIEWAMNEEQMKAFEKIILDKTKDTKYQGKERFFADGTGNTEIRTNDNEQLIDTLLIELKVSFIKIKR